MTIDATVNARYGRIVLGLYAGFNALLLIGACAVLWYFNGQAHDHGISPNAKVGFRTQHTLASLHGWYVAQRAGFHFAAIAATVITVVVFVLVALAAVRRLSALWILIVPIVGGLAIGGCLILAGHKADAAAVSVEKPAAAAWSSSQPPNLLV
jgi:hypothetical protein